MECTTDEGVAQVLERLPERARQHANCLRQLILESAEEEGLEALAESLRWGELSYIAKGGSTVRMGWSEKTPDDFNVFFHCQTRLVDTFRELYADTLRFDGNRAIVLQLGDALPEQELKHCVALALTYHRRKHLPLLGA